MKKKKLVKKSKIGISDNTPFIEEMSTVSGIAGFNGPVNSKFKKKIRETFNKGDDVYAIIGRGDTERVVRGKYVGKKQDVDGVLTHAMKQDNGEITLHPRMKKGKYKIKEVTIKKQTGYECPWCGSKKQPLSTKENLDRAIFNWGSAKNKADVERNPLMCQSCNQVGAFEDFNVYKNESLSITKLLESSFDLSQSENSATSWLEKHFKELNQSYKDREKTLEILANMSTGKGISDSFKQKFIDTIKNLYQKGPETVLKFLYNSYLKGSSLGLNEEGEKHSLKNIPTGSETKNRRTFGREFLRLKNVKNPGDKFNWNNQIWKLDGEIGTQRGWAKRIK